MVGIIVTMCDIGKEKSQLCHNRNIVTFCIFINVNKSQTTRRAVTVARLLEYNNNAERPRDWPPFMLQNDRFPTMPLGGFCSKVEVFAAIGVDVL